ncbi:hypothetical protein MMC17_004813 [Xylographa soralifera]|nr:hypothetical protein [Xylographa soralifera]
MTCCDKGDGVHIAETLVTTPSSTSSSTSVTSTITIATTSMSTFVSSMTPTSPLGLASSPTQVLANSTVNNTSSGISSSAKVGIGVGTSIAALVLFIAGLVAGRYFRRIRNAQNRSIRLPDTETENELVEFGIDPKNGNMSMTALQPGPPVEMEGNGLKQARYAELRG